MNQNYTTARITIGDNFLGNETFYSRELGWANKVSAAKELALKAHAGVYYQPENIPYTTHLHKVVNCLSSVFDGSFDLDFASTLGWLHDVVEDTSITIKDLQIWFPIIICEGVAALTKNKLLSKAEQMEDSLD
jgi:(p)ppGpp synthase/HD superfamily hydrolase